MKPKTPQKRGFGRVDPTGVEPALHTCQQWQTTVIVRAQCLLHADKFYNKKEPFSRRFFVDTCADPSNNESATYKV